ncbi:DsbA family protein [Anaeromyxobacter paludicola]|uniref:Thioredoxin domain-containing protein n=1 Tax=Anaeromyxobacter paludicola TaxID=2918171 RepID=A0ABM7X797_9BACT|nr:thioredoxin domain-containing protein [Anaeromyxobacter paludicola]BDG07683.1 hypothetical protein AMPC_07960 [Anaeromyxobacter paludicola]
MSTPFRTIVLAALAAALAACGSTAATPSTLARVPVDGAPQRGPADAWVTVVEFADFQCPYCRAEEPVLDDILTSYGPYIRLAFKHYPLPQHANARPAAIAAQCAFEQGHFWELHDLLLQTALDDYALLADARQVAGLDVPTWQACLASAEAAAQVDADAALGASVGVPGTPTFVVNGELVVGAVPDAVLRAAVDRALAAAQASGIPAADYYRRAILGE